MATAHAADDRRDGNWWLGSSKPTKVFYVVGFFDGMELGNNFSIWHWDDKPERERASSLAVTSYVLYSGKYLANVTSGQLADGLDSFYADFRNRKIVTASAVWVVLKEIAGADKEEVAKLTENLRKSTK